MVPAGSARFRVGPSFTDTVRTWIARSGDERTNHEVTVPPTELVICGACK